MNPNAPLKREQVEALAREAPEALVGLIMVMQEQLAVQRAEIARLQARVAELEAQNRPPGAPFRRRAEERSAAPRKPGRAPGHPGSCRRVPEVVDEIIGVPLRCCPDCAGALEMLTPVEQFIEELPAVRPHLTRLTTYEGRCPRCAKLVRSTHPRQMSTAGGCAGVQLGARAVALAAELKHGLGLPRQQDLPRAGTDGWFESERGRPGASLRACRGQARHRGRGTARATARLARAARG